MSTERPLANPMSDMDKQLEFLRRIADALEYANYLKEMEGKR